MLVKRFWRSRGSLGVRTFTLFSAEISVSADPASPTDVTTDDWAFCLLPLDDDIISLELPEFFRDNFLVRIQTRS